MMTRIVSMVAEADLKTIHGEFKMHACESDGERALVLTRGGAFSRKTTAVRIQSSCLFGETFGASECDCRWQVHHSLDKISSEGGGVFIYLFQEGRGVGLFEKVKLYGIEQKFKCDTIEAFRIAGYDKPDLRHYALAVAILKYFRIRSCKILSNNPEKVTAFDGSGIKATMQSMLREPKAFKELIGSIGDADPTALLRYLKQKQHIFHHNINIAFIDAFFKNKKLKEDASDD